MAKHKQEITLNLGLHRSRPAQDKIIQLKFGKFISGRKLQFSLHTAAFNCLITTYSIVKEFDIKQLLKLRVIESLTLIHIYTYLAVIFFKTTNDSWNESEKREGYIFTGSVDQNWI